MSTFSIEEQITLKASGDIIDRESYHTPVKPQKCYSARVLAFYSFPEQTARCAVNDCLQPHHQGFLIVTREEKEANLCETCGRRFLKTTVKEVESGLQEQARRREQQIKLNAVLQRGDQIKERINALKQDLYGANWLYRSLTNFHKAYPAELLALLKQLATRTGSEGPDTGTHQEGGELVGGLGIFRADIKEMLMGQIYKPLKELEEMADNPETTAPLASFCRWAESLEERFSAVESVIDEGRVFFERSNMERLKSLSISEKSARLLRSLRWDREGAKVKGV